MKHPLGFNPKPKPAGNCWLFLYRAMTKQRTTEELEDKIPMLARWAFRRAHRQAIETVGYNIVSRDGYLIRLYADGHHDIIKKLPERLKVPVGLRVNIT